MKNNSIILLLLLGSMSLSAQNVDNDKAALMSEIEKNNTTLAALRQKVIADKQLNGIDNVLPDPSFNFSNTWSNQPGSVTAQGYSIEQELDWGTISGRRSKTTKSANREVDLKYLAERQTLLAEADLLIIELIYYNALCEELSIRKERASLLRDLFTKKFAAGDADRLELNKVKLNYTATMADLRKAKADRDAISDDLQRLNGNKPFVFKNTKYTSTALPPLSELMIMAEKNAPQIALVNNAIELEQQRLKLSQSEGIPNLTVGYAGSSAKHERTNALTVGFDIPLWGNSRRKVKQQRAAIAVAELEKTDVVTKIKSTLKKQYANAISLKEISEQFNKELNENEDIDILNKALNTGKLSLIEYLNEITFYYNAHDRALEAERDVQISFSNMWKIFRVY